MDQSREVLTTLIFYVQEPDWFKFNFRRKKLSLLILWANVWWPNQWDLNMQGIHVDSPKILKFEYPLRPLVNLIKILFNLNSHPLQFEQNCFIKLNLIYKKCATTSGIHQKTFTKLRLSLHPSWFNLSIRETLLKVSFRFRLVEIVNFCGIERNGLIACVSTENVRESYHSTIASSIITGC